MDEAIGMAVRCPLVFASQNAFIQIDCPGVLCRYSPGGCSKLTPSCPHLPKGHPPTHITATPPAAPTQVLEQGLHFPPLLPGLQRCRCRRLARVINLQLRCIRGGPVAQGGVASGQLLKVQLPSRCCRGRGLWPRCRRHCGLGLGELVQQMGSKDLLRRSWTCTVTTHVHNKRLKVIDTC